MSWCGSFKVGRQIMKDVKLIVSKLGEENIRVMYVEIYKTI